MYGTKTKEEILAEIKASRKTGEQKRRNIKYRRANNCSECEIAFFDGRRDLREWFCKDLELYVSQEYVCSRFKRKK